MRAASTLLCFVPLLWAGPPAWGEPPPSVLTPTLVSQLRSATGVLLSQDGRWQVYQISQPRRFSKEDYEDGPAYPEAYSLEDDGHYRPLLNQHVAFSQLRLSPDDRSLTFLSKRNQDKQTCLYRLDKAGGEPQRILHFKTDILDYALAPRGNRVAFSARAPLSEEHKNLKKMGFRAEVFEEDWQPARLYLGATGNETCESPPVELQGSVADLKWSPDGSLLALSLAPNPGVDAQLMFRRIQLLRAQDGKPLRTLENPGKLGQFDFSPDGKQLAMITAEDLHDPDHGRLWVADCATGKLRDLWPGLEGRVAKFEWIGGDRLRVLVFRGLTSEVWDLDLQGSRQQRPGLPDEVVTDLSCDAEGRRSLYVSESPRHPGEVFLQPGGEPPRRLTRLNPALERLRWARQEAVRYSARDGTALDGVLIHPLEGTARGPAPLLMWVHGGPESQVVNGWLNGYSMPGQVAAARGYGVLYPNYRGSIGRSVAFSKAGQGDPAGKEFDDLVDGVDFLLQRGGFDARRVGITGASYGGYATAWCSTFYSDRFAAGVMSVGISDKVSKSGTTDIPEEEFLVHARKRPWEHWDFFRQRSPIAHVQKHRTPLLIMHGKDDPRVHPSQSLELYRYLKMLGQAPVRLVLYPEEGHGNRKAAARFDYQLRMLEWFDHYLGGEGNRQASPPDWDLRPPLPTR